MGWHDAGCLTLLNSSEWMLEIMDYMDELLAQRGQFINTFYAFKSNADESRARLIACARLLVKKQHSFFSNPEITNSLSVLSHTSEKEQSQSEYLLMLQLYAGVHQNTQDVAKYLYQSHNLKLQSLAPLFSLLTRVERAPLQHGNNEALLNNQLVAAFYCRQSDVITQFYLAQHPHLSPLTQLYATVLGDNSELSHVLVSDFISCDYLHSHLFELYVVMLDERQLTDVVNHLSSDDKHTALIMNIMALSGYSKFIPFLARYLQNKIYTLNAHRALRILMGPSLDSLIPDAIQFESEEKQRVQDFTYYGAKILHYWDQTLIQSLGARVLSGLTITPKNIAKIWLNGSQIHRRIAALHSTQLADKCGVYYYAFPEAVL